MQQFCPARPAGAMAGNGGRPPGYTIPSHAEVRMSIWFRPYTLDELQRLNADGLGAHLDIRFTEIGPDYLRASMPVDERTRQPFGLLHGGASVSLAETLGSVAANCCSWNRKTCTTRIRTRRARSNQR